MCEEAGRLAVILSDGRTKEHFLVSCDAKKPPTSTLAESSPRCPLPGKVHSLHALMLPRRQGGGGGLECVAAVLQSGDVAWLQASALVGGSGDMQLIAGPSAAAAGRAAKPRASSSAHNKLAVLCTSMPGTAAHVQLYAFNASGDALSATHMLSVTCPTGSPAAAPVDVVLARSYVLVVWSSGVVSILKLSGGDGGGGSAAQVDVDCSDEIAATSIPAAAAAAAAATPVGKKRGAAKQEDKQASTRQLPLVALIDDTQFVIAYVDSNNGSLRYTLVDAQFGCSVTRGNVALDALSPSAVAEAAASGACRLYSSPSASPGLLVLQLAAAVLGLTLDAPPASLLSLVGQMSLQPSASQGTVGSLDVKALAAASAPSAAAVGPPVHAGGRGGSGQLQQVPASVAAAASSVRAALPEHTALLRELEGASSSSSSSSSSLPASTKAGATKAKAGTAALLERALKCLVTQPADAAAPPPPPALVALLAQRLAEAEQWDGLQQLLGSASALPADGAGLPESCSWLLPVAARAGQYRLLAPLCCRLDELRAADVVAALAVLLVPTTASNLGPRKEHHAFVRCAAWPS